ncbi:DedA family protein [Corynebacterium frankenforstense]|uniref:DedA family protein n=1 Tax=Corynebacterium TaxID=1716 RepID=UPI00254F8364|nr:MULTISPECIES: DedA family protein [Corynebacterium]MDK6260202.1 DedA family protein [Corynebacterium frankenforstense]MDK8896281.1 DedA family protein [Corynebacterium sp. MSK006]
MADQLTVLIEAVLGSWWFHPLLAFFIVGDALCPLLPSETIITAGAAWSASRGVPDVWAVWTIAVVAAVIGDNICYLLGTRLVMFVRSMPPKSKMGRAVDWVEKSIRTRAAMTIIVARFVPWGRWVLTIMLGAMKYPWWLFLLIDSVGVVVWVSQAVLIGYLGGWVLQDYPILGMILGVTLGALVGVLIDRVRQYFSDAHQVRTGTSRA